MLRVLAWNFSHGIHGIHRTMRSGLCHADGADFRGSRAEQILWSSVSSVWNDNSDRRTKGHNAPRTCLEFFTRNTQNHAEWIVSRRRCGLSRKRAEQILWSSVSSVWDDNSDRRTKGHNAPRTCLEFFTRNTRNTQIFFWTEEHKNIFLFLLQRLKGREVFGTTNGHSFTNEGCDSQRMVINLIIRRYNFYLFIHRCGLFAGMERWM